MSLFSLESKILAPFLGALVIFAGSAALYLSSAAELLEGVSEQTLLGRINSEVHETLNALVDAETSQRGYLITGMDSYLGPYHFGVTEADLHLQVLEQLSADTPEDRERLAAIRALKELLLQKLMDSIELRKSKGFEAARAEVILNHGKEDMDRIRAHFAALLQSLAVREGGNLERLTAARQSVHVQLWGLFGVMGLMLAAAYWVILREVRMRFQLARHLKYEATHDGLTGLPNRRFFTQWMERSLAQARREQRPLALLYLDLDGFKRVNDQLGHEMGDHLLQAVTQRFRDTLRESDMLARLGGDEFAILTPEASAPEMVGVLAERLIASLKDPLLPQFGNDYPVGVSIGIACFPDHAATSAQLTHAADEAMYAAKRGGRNCFRFHIPAAGTDGCGRGPAALISSGSW